MLAEAYISHTLPFVRPTDAQEAVLHYMDVHHTRELPVVEDDMLVGITTQEIVFESGHPAVLSDSEHIFIDAQQHVFDAVGVMQEHGVSIVPVVNSKNNYLGCIGREDLMRCFAEVVSVEERGHEVVLCMQRHDYSLVKLTSIIEADRGKVLHVFLRPGPDSYEVYVNLKISAEEITPILLAIERYGYTIAHTFSEQSLSTDSIDRYESLLRFLDV